MNFNQLDNVVIVAHSRKFMHVETVGVITKKNKFTSVGLPFKFTVGILVLLEEQFGIDLNFFITFSVYWV